MGVCFLFSTFLCCIFFFFFYSKLVYDRFWILLHSDWRGIVHMCWYPRCRGSWRNIGVESGDSFLKVPLSVSFDELSPKVRFLVSFDELSPKVPFLVNVDELSPKVPFSVNFDELSPRVPFLVNLVPLLGCHAVRFANLCSNPSIFASSIAIQPPYTTACSHTDPQSSKRKKHHKLIACGPLWPICFTLFVPFGNSLFFGAE